MCFGSHRCASPSTSQWASGYCSYDHKIDDDRCQKFEPWTGLNEKFKGMQVKFVLVPKVMTGNLLSIFDDEKQNSKVIFAYTAAWDSIIRNRFMVGKTVKLAAPKEQKVFNKRSKDGWT